MKMKEACWTALARPTSSLHRHQRLYSKDGIASRASFVAPARTNLPSTCVSWLTGIATSCLPTPKKPPAPIMAYEIALSGATTMSSTAPIRSFLSLKTVWPSTWRVALQPAVTLRSSAIALPTTVDPATCACAMVDVINAMLASIKVVVRVMVFSFNLNAIELAWDRFLSADRLRSLVRQHGPGVLSCKPRFQCRLFSLYERCDRNVRRCGGVTLGLSGAILQLSFHFPIGDLVAGRRLFFFGPILDLGLSGGNLDSTLFDVPAHLIKVAPHVLLGEVGLAFNVNPRRAKATRRASGF